MRYMIIKKKKKIFVDSSSVYSFNLIFTIVQIIGVLSKFLFQIKQVNRNIVRKTYIYYISILLAFIVSKKL